MNKIILLVIVALAGINDLAAQQKTISGKVSDEKWLPIAGASVIIKGGKACTVTKENGSYVLAVPATAKFFIVSKSGYKSEEVAIRNLSVINVRLTKIKKKPGNATEQGIENSPVPPLSATL